MLSLFKNSPRTKYAVLCAMFYLISFVTITYLLKMPNSIDVDYFTFRRVAALVASYAIFWVYSFPSAYINDIQLKKTDLTSTNKFWKLLWIGFLNGIVPITLVEIGFLMLVMITGPDDSWKTLLLSVNWLFIDCFFVAVNLLTLFVLRAFSGEQTHLSE